MRAVAVLVVFAHHAVGAPTGGFVGVDVFFVISGFLITGLLIREHDRSGRISIIGFYKRRLRRLAPAATVTIGVVVLSAWAVFYSARFQQVAGDGIWSFAFMANWRFILTRTDYFAADGPVSPLQHFWSLSVEEQYYIVWPWLMILVLTLFVARWGRNKARVLLTALSMIAVISFALGFFWPFNLPSVDYFNTFTRIWELALGGILAVLSPYLSSMSRRMRLTSGFLGLVLVVLGIGLITDDAAFPTPWALPPVVGTMLILAAGTGIAHGETVGVLRFLSWRPMRYIGDISYSLYLWHFPALIFGRLLFAPLGAAWLPLSVILGFALAAISYHLIEQPVLSSPWLRGRHSWRQWWSETRKSTIQAGAAAVVVGTVVIAIGVLDQATDAVAASGESTADVSEMLERAVEEPVMTSAAMARLEGPSDMAWSLGAETPCLNQTVQRSLAECRVGAGGPTALVVGDSFAAATFPAIAAALEENGYTSVGVMNSSCPVTTAPLEYPSRPNHEVACDARSSDLTGLVEQASADLVVVLDSETSYLAIKASDDRVQAYTVARREALTQLESVADVIIIEANPRAPSPVECLDRLTSRSDQCIGSPSDAWAEKASIDRQIAAEFGVPYIRTQDLYCWGGLCPVAAGDTVQRIDSGHLTASYVSLIAPEIMTRVSEGIRELRRSSD